jgi:hypothetical protein
MASGTSWVATYMQGTHAELGTHAGPVQRRCTQRRASAAPIRRAAGVVVSSMADATEPAMRDDDILPNDLFDAVSQAGQATAAAIKAVRARVLESHAPRRLAPRPSVLAVGACSGAVPPTDG